ncbi:hypothetical protein PHET_10967 [Paragonimus heterotremus]|uniref:Uncharacterized protein n=1 Tax=Paragonimus heterotremus TaxID=100268 RepID=A0A8J4WMN3_9TREM|nr:hypothetical protein PHET_10967 [Paragonimus heterotremus]
MSAICLKYTGILTTEQMAVDRMLIFAGKIQVGVRCGDSRPFFFVEYELTGSNYALEGGTPRKDVKIDCIKNLCLVELAHICALCNCSGLEYDETKGHFEKVRKYTEKALACLVEDINVSSVCKAGHNNRHLAMARSHELQQMDNKSLTLKFPCTRDLKSTNVIPKQQNAGKHGKLLAKDAP